ncbi:MAG: TraR/DksA C4-type zinc finger protein [Pseudomonas sp.]|uniref:TraR/DksA C4-type zinc finger protein n=1 Tax=Pseudomonas sp. TaxID=306 RepID=UPI0027369C32|nr:TraR/DksA C4-type zinc finger protein [Pseudomonas sp.]MDP3848608.1 TraR/DksA C4-type zinc finger protein [Pseudomonas sp.]
MDERAFDLAGEAEEKQRQQGVANRVQYCGVSALECGECGEGIPEKRRLAIPGCQLCVDCQQLRERRV